MFKIIIMMGQCNIRWQRQLKVNGKTNFHSVCIIWLNWPTQICLSKDCWTNVCLTRKTHINIMANHLMEIHKFCKVSHKQQFVIDHSRKGLKRLKSNIKIPLIADCFPYHLIQSFGCGTKNYTRSHKHH